MNTIYKYPITPEFTLTLPIGAKPLCVQTQDSQPMMWVLQKKHGEAYVEQRRFISVPTGGNVPDNAGYVGTFQTVTPEMGVLVFHVFESNEAK